MKLLFKIDQAAFIRAGHDAPQSTAHVEVVPSELSVEDRAVIADMLRNGHDLTAGIYAAIGWEVGRCLDSLPLTSPGLEGVREWCEKQRELRAFAAAEIAETRRKAIEQFESEIANPSTEMRAYYLEKVAGKLERDWCGADYDCPTRSYIKLLAQYSLDPRSYPPEIQEQVVAEDQRRATALAEQLAAALPQLQEQLAEKRAVRDAETAQRAAELEAKRELAARELDGLLSLLPELTRERFQGGYMTDEEEFKVLSEAWGIQLGLSDYSAMDYDSELVCCRETAADELLYSRLRSVQLAVADVRPSAEVFLVCAQEDAYSEEETRIMIRDVVAGRKLSIILD